MNDDFIKALLGDVADSSKEQQLALWADFQLFMSVMFFKDLCTRHPDPKQCGEEVIAEWRNRVITQADAQIAKGEELRTSPVGKLFGEVLPTPDESRAQLQDNLNDVEQILRRIVNIGME